ncbi:MAG TPA: hypothetical protein VL492_08070, partial [Methylovirgula sp.]|nr:hypothetical protein [Methylovirgula sp.]
MLPEPQPLEPAPLFEPPPPVEVKAAPEIVAVPETKVAMERKMAVGQERARFAFDQLGEQGEQMAQQVHSIMGRFEDVLTLRDEFGAFIHTFDELMGAH